MKWEYEFNNDHEIFSKVPIEVERHISEECTYFKDLPNPDYGNINSTRWNHTIETLSWVTLNWGNYKYKLAYNTSWDEFMPAWKEFFEKNKRCYIDNILPIKEICDKMYTALFDADIEYAFQILVEGILINKRIKDDADKI